MDDDEFYDTKRIIRKLDYKWIQNQRFGAQLTWVSEREIEREKFWEKLYY